MDAPVASLPLPLVRFAFADAEDLDDFEDAPSDEVEAGEEEIVDQATGGTGKKLLTGK